jgi:hypothetical protein
MQEAPVCVGVGPGFHVPGDGCLSARSGEAGFGVSGLHEGVGVREAAAMRAVASSNLWMSWCSGAVPGRSR